MPNPAESPSLAASSSSQKVLSRSQLKKVESDSEVSDDDEDASSPLPQKPKSPAPQKKPPPKKDDPKPPAAKEASKKEAPKPAAKPAAKEPAKPIKGAPANPPSAWSAKCKGMKEPTQYMVRTQEQRREFSRKATADLYALLLDPLHISFIKQFNGRKYVASERVKHTFHLMPFVLYVPAHKALPGSIMHPVVPLLRVNNQTKELTIVWVVNGPITGWAPRSDNKTHYPHETRAFDLDAEHSKALIGMSMVAYPKIPWEMHQKTMAMLWTFSLLLPTTAQGKMFSKKVLNQNDFRGMLKNMPNEKLTSTMLFVQPPPRIMRMELLTLANNAQAAEVWMKKEHGSFLNINAEWFNVPVASLPGDALSRSDLYKLMQSYVENSSDTVTDDYVRNFLNRFDTPVSPVVPNEISPKETSNPTPSKVSRRNAGKDADDDDDDDESDEDDAPINSSMNTAASAMHDEDEEELEDDGEEDEDEQMEEDEDEDDDDDDEQMEDDEEDDDDEDEGRRKPSPKKRKGENGSIKAPPAKAQRGSIEQMFNAAAARPTSNTSAPSPKPAPSKVPPKASAKSPAPNGHAAPPSPAGSQSAASVSGGKRRCPAWQKRMLLVDNSRDLLAQLQTLRNAPAYRNQFGAAVETRRGALHDSLQAFRAEKSSVDDAHALIHNLVAALRVVAEMAQSPAAIKQQQASGSATDADMRAVLLTAEMWHTNLPLMKGMAQTFQKMLDQAERAANGLYDTQVTKKKGPKK